MHDAAAGTAYPCSTFFAFAHFATTLENDMIWFDPFSATTRGAVDTILGGVFLKLPVPGLFEFLVE
jgi:hypothetical protein